MDNHLLSVIIPFLNEGQEVENTLQTIRASVGNTVDIILINDASNDNVNYSDIAKKFNARYVTNKKRLGVAKSRDKGITLSNTPYFLLLDAHMRFYQNDWAVMIVEELKKNSRILLCCNTKVLVKDDCGNIDEPINTSAFGAEIDLCGDLNMLNLNWSYYEQDPHIASQDIPCVLGAGYAASKEYWLYLRGLEGLLNYGSDECYISLKVWLEGGQCRLLKNIIIGHIYRKQAPFKIEYADSIFNKLWIAEVLLPIHYRLRTYGALYAANPVSFTDAFLMLKKKRRQINKLRQYYKQIFTINFDYIVGLNQRTITETEKVRQEHQIVLKQIFLQLLLNFNTLDSDGLWYGRMGCLLFLAKYDSAKNDSLYSELINILIDEIYARLKCRSLNVDLGYGLCGIAYGIAWLVENELMDGDLNEILQDVDSCIMERDPSRINDYSLESGLAGIIYYILYRLQIAQKHNTLISFDQVYLDRLHKICLKVTNDKDKLNCFEMASWYIAYRENPELELKIPNIIQLLNLTTLNTAVMGSNNMSLKNGLAGLGLKLSY